jgi:hypothetical protein
MPSRSGPPLLFLPLGTAAQIGWDRAEWGGWEAVRSAGYVALLPLLSRKAVRIWERFDGNAAGWDIDVDLGRADEAGRTLCTARMAFRATQGLVLLGLEPLGPWALGLAPNERGACGSSCRCLLGSVHRAAACVGPRRSDPTSRAHNCNTSPPLPAPSPQLGPQAAERQARPGVHAARAAGAGSAGAAPVARGARGRAGPG